MAEPCALVLCLHQAPALWVAHTDDYLNQGSDETACLQHGAAIAKPQFRHISGEKALSGVPQAGSREEEFYQVC